MATQEEKKNKQIGWAISLGVHTALILLLIFILAWKEPNPPNPEYGIELNIGLEQQQGFGTEQPQPSQQEEVVEETQPETQPEEIIEEEPIESEPVEETQEVTQEPVQEVGPDVIEEEPKPEVKPEPKPEPQPKEAPEPEPVKEEPKEQVDSRALFPGNKSGQTKGESEATSQGDQRDQTGDQGSEQGSVDSRALYGSQGGGDGGPQFNLSNWAWNKTNVQKDDSAERGKIVFEIIVDEYGEIISYKVIQSTVSRSVINFYADQVEDFTFSFKPSSPGVKPASESKGTITFFITSN